MPGISVYEMKLMRMTGKEIYLDVRVGQTVEGYSPRIWNEYRDNWQKKGQTNFVLKIFPVQSAHWLIEVHFPMPIDQALMTVIRT